MREVNCDDGPMVWRGGKVVQHELSKEEVFLGFEPNSYFDEDESAIVIFGSPPVLLPVFEICAFSEAEQNLEHLFEKEKKKIADMFEEACLLVSGDPNKIPPQRGDSGKRHELDWQLFQLVRVIGRRNDESD